MKLSLPRWSGNGMTPSKTSNRYRSASLRVHVKGKLREFATVSDCKPTLCDSAGW